jgi:hypothetical protein
MFKEALEVRQSAKKVYEQTYTNYGGSDEKNGVNVFLPVEGNLYNAIFKLF